MEKLLKFLRYAPAVIIPGDGSNLVQPIHYYDLAEGMVNLVVNQTEQGVYFAAGPRAESFQQLIYYVKKAVGRTWIPVFHFPAKLAEKSASYLGFGFFRPDQITRFRESRAVDGAVFQAAVGRPMISLESGLGQEARLLFRGIPLLEPS
jgi:nucleoside-diphosphate-sugar epimerase